MAAGVDGLRTVADNHQAVGAAADKGGEHLDVATRELCASLRTKAQTLNAMQVRLCGSHRGVGLACLGGRVASSAGWLGRGPLIATVDAALEQQRQVLDKIRDGKVQATGAVIGAVVKTMGGKVDAPRSREFVLERAEG